MAKKHKTSPIDMFKTDFRFDNGHVVGSSGIPRPTKYNNRERKAANRNANLNARRSINSAFSNSSKGPHNKTPVWHGAINGTPATAGAVK